MPNSRCGISRNNSSTSSDSGHTRASFKNAGGRRFSCQICRCHQFPRTGRFPIASSANSSSASSASLAESDAQDAPINTSNMTAVPLPSTTTTTTTSTPATATIHRKSATSAMGKQMAQELFSRKAATLDSVACHRANLASMSDNVNSSHSSENGHHQFQHHPDCHYAALNQSDQRPRKASNKLQQSPSSLSSHSNASSLFRDDGFEDDLLSTASEQSSTMFYQRPAPFFHQHGAQNDHHHHLSNNQHHHYRLLEGELSSPSITQRVVGEIIETERSYVDDLEQIVSGYLCHLRDMLSQHRELFSNLEDIYKFNKDLLLQLEECYLNPGAVAACFVENALKFDVYTHYCTMYPLVVSTLTKLMANSDTAQLLKERQLELNQSLPLGAYLLKPVQRILKYHILFKSLIRHTADDETVVDKDRDLINEAFSVMTSIACHINEMKKKHEHSIRVQELQGLLCEWEGPDLTTLGELILEDTFKLCNRQRSTRHLLLFDNVLLITKKKHDGSLLYKGHIECSNLMLIETIEGQPLVFHTVPFDNPKALCAFQADNLEKKRDWCLQMKEVIIKSFEVKIPTHVRDLLMSLTKSNATDTTNKSSLSEAAKSVKAPNYLEKKRNKQQDKKKS